MPNSVVEVLRGPRSRDQEALAQQLRERFRLQARAGRVPEQDVEDLVQQGLLHLLQKLHLYRADAPFEHWASVVFVRLRIEYFRRKRLRDVIQTNRTEAVDPYPPSHHDVFEAVANAQALRMVVAVVTEVVGNSARNRRIANDWLAGLEPMEIQERLAKDYPTLSANAIRIVLHNLREEIRKVDAGAVEGS